MVLAIRDATFLLPILIPTDSIEFRLFHECRNWFTLTDKASVSCSCKWDVISQEIPLYNWNSKNNAQERYLDFSTLKILSHHPERLHKYAQIPAYRDLIIKQFNKIKVKESEKVTHGRNECCALKPLTSMEYSLFTTGIRYQYRYQCIPTCRVKYFMRLYFM